MLLNRLRSLAAPIITTFLRAPSPIPFTPRMRPLTPLSPRLLRFPFFLPRTLLFFHVDHEPVLIRAGDCRPLPIIASTPIIESHPAPVSLFISCRPTVVLLGPPLATAPDSHHNLYGEHHTFLSLITSSPHLLPFPESLLSRDSFCCPLACHLLWFLLQYSRVQEPTRASGAREGAASGRPAVGEERGSRGRSTSRRGERYCAHDLWRSKD